MSSALSHDAAIPALEAYAAAGGVVWVQGAIQGTEGEDCYRLPFGGQSCVDFGFSDPIVDLPIRWWRACPVLSRATLPVR